MQGGSFTLAEMARGLSPDVILASDMLNLPAFLALARDSLSDVPVAVYCHENQLTYPLPPGEKRDLTYGMINWLSMLAADRVFFNSQYHLEDWFGALPNMLKHFPDYSHRHRIEGVLAKSLVLPVGCHLARLDGIPENRSDDTPLILWNQRWEYDKDPETFFLALYALQGEGVDFRVAVAGKSHRQTAPEFQEARDRLGDRVVHFGFADGDEYVRLLKRADIVVSTAVHEFFGVAVVEALYAGAFPVLPNRLSYPELIPDQYHQQCLYQGFHELVTRLRWALDYPEEARAAARELRVALQAFDWGTLAEQYDGEMEILCQ